VNCSAENIADALALSTATDCVVDGFIGDGVATACGTAGIVGAGNVIRNCEFYHGGVGASDVALVNYNATGKNWIEGNRFEDFHTGIYIGSEAVALINNTTVNSGSAGMRKDNDAQAGQVIHGNTWDSTNPALIQSLQRIEVGKALLWATAAPTIRTWAIGDRCYNSAPAAGQPKSWVCTTAGTPGTWTSEGNL
jgi:hypothetical protein